MARRALTIGGLIYGGFLLLIVLIVGASVAGILALREIDASFTQVKDLAAVSKRGADLRNEAAILLRDAATFAGDPTEARRNQVRMLAGNIKAASIAIRARLGPEGRDAIEYLDGIADNLDAFLGEFEKLAAFMAQAPDIHAAAMSPEARRILTAMDRYGRQIARITGLVAETTSSKANDFTEVAQGELEAGIWRTAAIAVICAVIGVLIALLVVRRTVGPLSRFTQVMTRLAGGALDTQVPYVAQRNEIGAMARATDVFKAAMLDVKAARDEAEAAARAKADFLAVMSHEIRTPMNGVLTMADLLHESRLDDEQRGMTQIVRDSARSLLTIINDILDFSKIEAGKLPLEEVEIDLADLVRGVAELLNQQAAEKTLELAVYVDPALPRRLVGDPTRLRQILVNLTGNAIKFTERGSVSLIAQAAGDGTLRLEITDTGIGLTPAQQAKLFQPFQQADSSTARKYGGTGLGLSICRRLVELMGGRIGVGAGPGGQGSTFWFVVPVVAGSAAPDTRPRLDTLRIAVAGTSAATREAAAAYLTAAGAEIVEDDADLHVVGAGAHDIAGPAVLLATRGSASLRAEAARLGFSAVVVEPIHRRDLVQAAAVALGLASAAGSVTTPEAGLGRRLPDRAEALAAGALVLVAEDNHTNRVVVRKLLDRLGYQADIVDDGAAAWAALQQAPYALLITDCHMPGMDGYELTARVREAERGAERRLPIVALTADALSDTVRKCLAAGMDAHLAKPIDIPALDAVLARFTQAVPAAASAPGNADAPVAIDPAILDLARLRRTFGSFDEAAAELLADFLADLPGGIDRIADGVARAAWKPAAERAHTLKGAAGSIGAGQLGSALGALQAALGRQDGPEAERSLAEVRRVAAGLVEASAPLLAATFV
jgi:signal transduction histidine kinase/CheY-like chemotaxis protein